MRKQLILTILVVLILSAAITVSCTIFSPIVGKWESSKSNKYEFTRDGKVIIEESGYIATGTYELISDNIVKLRLEGFAGNVNSFFGGDTWQYKISGDTMTVTVSGKTTTLTRRGSASSATSTPNTQINKPVSSTTISVSGNVVTFPDANLEATIRKAISKPVGAIYKADLQVLTQLDGLRRNISNLKGLEFCTNITILYLNGNQISNISQLSSLTKLTQIFLEENKISDISALASLSGLTALYLDSNRISDLAPLLNSGLSNGGIVYLKNNPLSAKSINTYTPQLRNKGVRVEY